MTLYFSLGEDLTALAAHTGIPLAHLYLYWLDSPAVAPIIARHRAHRAYLREQAALDCLHHILRASADPVEQRRAATATLRAIHRPPAPAATASHAPAAPGTPAATTPTASTAPAAPPAPRARAPQSAAQAHPQPPRIPPRLPLRLADLITAAAAAGDAPSHYGSSSSSVPAAPHAGDHALHHSRALIAAAEAAGLDDDLDDQFDLDDDDDDEDDDDPDSDLDPGDDQQPAADALASPAPPFDPDADRAAHFAPTPGSVQSPAGLPIPDRQRTWTDVAHLILEAYRDPDTPAPGSGLHVLFNFSTSSAIDRSTAAFERFRALTQEPRDLLRAHTRAALGTPLHHDTGAITLPVTLHLARGEPLDIQLILRPGPAALVGCWLHQFTTIPRTPPPKNLGPAG